MVTPVPCSPNSNVLAAGSSRRMETFTIYQMWRYYIIMLDTGHWSLAAAGNTIPGGAEWKLIGQSRAGSRPRVWRHSYAYISNIYYTFCIYISTYDRYYLLQCTGYQASVKVSPWKPEGIRCRRNVTSLHPPITRQSRPHHSVNIVTQTMCFQYFLEVTATKSQHAADFIYILILF